MCTLRFICLFTLLVSPGIALATFKVDLSAAQVQASVRFHFPLREYSASARIALRGPEVRLSPGVQALILVVPVEVSLPGEGQRAGEAMVSVGLRYKAHTGEVFLHAPRVTVFRLSGVDEGGMAEFRATVENVLTKALPLVRIYTVYERDLNHTLTKSVLKAAIFGENRLSLEFGFK